MAVKTQETVTVKNKKRGSWFDKIFLIIAFLFAVIVVYFVWSNAQQGAEPFIFGFRPYIITSGSMEPYLKVNSLIVIQRNTYEEVKASDVISYKITGPNGSTSVCHRVVEITPNGLITKGDNNVYNDTQPVKKEQYVGKLVLKLNTVANYINFLSKKGAFLAVVLPLAGIFFLIFAFSFLRKKEKIQTIRIIETIEVEDDDDDGQSLESKDEASEEKKQD